MDARGKAFQWMSLLLLSGLLVAGTLSQPTRPPTPAPPPAAIGTERVVAVPVEGALATGRLVLPPSGAPTTLVVFAHQFQGRVERWDDAYQEVARHGAAALAMKYRGPDDGWNARSGAVDTVIATQWVTSHYPTIHRVILYGYSLGGEVAGMAIAQAPSGTFQVWIDGAGVADLLDEYQAIPAFRPSIEAETGGPPAKDALAYTTRSPLALAPQIARKGLEYVTILHAPADPVVPFSQSARLANALEAHGTAVDLRPVSVTWTIRDCPPGGPPCVTTAAPVVAGHEAGDWPVARSIVLEAVHGNPLPRTTQRAGALDATHAP